MVQVLAVVSAIVMGGVFALAARALGVDRDGILVAIGVIGAGLQLIAIIVWYLYYTRPRTGLKARFGAQHH